MITQFPLDYLHLVLLGACKKLLLLWLKGHTISRLSVTSVNKISNMMIFLREYVPSEFQRKSRSLIELPFWKGTEYLLFLLYLGTLVLINVIPKEFYYHFNVLSCAIRILCTPQDCLQNIEAD